MTDENTAKAMASFDAAIATSREPAAIWSALQALAEAVLGALAADDDAAREARRSAYRSNYTPEAVAAKHDALYLELLKR